MNSQAGRLRYVKMKFPKGIKPRSANHHCTPETSAHIGSVENGHENQAGGRTSKSRPANNGAVGADRIELGEYIVADPLICHGKPTFKGTRMLTKAVMCNIDVTHENGHRPASPP